MTLNECIEMGRECGLTTLGEAYDNVSIHATSLFKWEDIEKEIQELNNEIGAKYGFKEISDNIDEILI